MKDNFTLLLFVLVIAINVIEITNISMAIRLYDEECVSRIAGSEASAFGSVRIMAGIFSCGFTLALAVWVANDYTDRLFDAGMFAISLMYSLYYLVFASMRAYRECTAMYNVVIALVVTPIIVPTGMIYIYLFIKYAYIPCMRRFHVCIVGCKKEIDDIRVARDMIIESRERESKNDEVVVELEQDQ